MLLFIYPMAYARNHTSTNAENNYFGYSDFCYYMYFSSAKNIEAYTIPVLELLASRYIVVSKRVLYARAFIRLLDMYRVLFFDIEWTNN